MRAKRRKLELSHRKTNPEDFEEAWKAGRAEKNLIDLGWEKMMQVFNVYGQSGGGKANEAIAETILAAARQERDSEQYLPTLIVGDINVDPKKLQNLVELVEEEGWIDVGLHADWWGSKPAEITCESRPGVKASRIDVIFASPEAVLYIREVWVKKNPMIPTHAAVG